MLPSSAPKWTVGPRPRSSGYTPRLASQCPFLGDESAKQPCPQRCVYMKRHETGAHIAIRHSPVASAAHSEKGLVNHRAGQRPHRSSGGTRPALGNPLHRWPSPNTTVEKPWHHVQDKCGGSTGLG